MDELTRREQQVVGLLARGLSNQAIASRFFLSVRTVEHHVGSIFGEFDLRDDDERNRRVMAAVMWTGTLDHVQEKDGVG